MMRFNKRVLVAMGVLTAPALGNTSEPSFASVARRLRQHEKVPGPSNPQLLDFANDGLEKVLADFLPSPYEVLQNQLLVQDSIDLGVCNMRYEATATSVKVYDLHKNIHIKEISPPEAVMDNILTGEVELRSTVKVELIPTKTTADIAAFADCGSVDPEATGYLEANIAGDYEMSIVAKLTLCNDGVQVSISVPTVDFDVRVTDVDLALTITCDYAWYEFHEAAVCEGVKGAYNVLRDEIEDQAEDMLNNAEVEKLVNELEITVAMALEDMANEGLGDLAGTCSI